MAKITGFFAPEQLNVVSVDGVIGECQECGLYKKCKSPRLEVTGEGQKRILIVGSEPGEKEDQSGIPMSGKSGIFLKDKLKAKGIDFDKDCWKINAVACHAEGGVTKKHIKCCRDRLMKSINDLKPLHIWLLGDTAIGSYFINESYDSTVTLWRALCIPDPDKKAWVVPLYHPAYILKNEKDDHLASTFDRDLSFAIKCSKFTDPPEHMPINKHVTILKNYQDVIRELENVLKIIPSKFAFDYETTGLKPHRTGHKIATISFCYDYDKAFSFPYEYRTHFTADQINHIGDLWIQIMEHPKIKKIACNSKFEDTWTRAIFGIDIANMWWCTAIAAHVLDNRSKFSGLKFQAFIRWGISNYDASVEKYIKATSKDSSFNRIMEAPLNDLLLYGGIDSLLGFRLQEEQEEDIGKVKSFEGARAFFMEGLTTLCDIQENGITMNREYYISQDKILTARIAEMQAALYKFPEAIKFQKYKGRQINFNSNHDLRELFFKVLGLESAKQTSGDNASVDASVLAQLDTPIAKEITRISKLEKIQGTYLAQFLREIEDDEKIHPFFDLLVPVTYRGSSSNPNFQNIPVRDEESKNITRSGIIPSIIEQYVGCADYPDYIGNKLIDWDYGAMEVRIIACYTKDPVLMSYIFDASTDMHRDMAIDLFKFGDLWQTIPKKKAKDIRFEAKNGATFPWFYGSYWRSVARNLFNQVMDMECYEGITVFEHLQAVGIIKNRGRAYEEFEAHIKQCEAKFWHKFKEVKKWQEWAWKSYLEKGYIEQLFGFRCSGWLTRNDVVNYPVQGTAFHCLMWAINRINKEMKRRRMLSKMNGQIHDCCLTDCFPPEQHNLMELSSRIATVEIREELKWLNVPLLIEWEQTEVNKSWATKEETREDYNYGISRM
jgi:uracil-DNA glycosylase family 4